MTWAYQRLYLKDPDFKSFTAMAFEVVSGGGFVSPTGAATTSPLASGVIEFGDIKVVTNKTLGDPKKIIGVAMNNTAISGTVTVICDGFLVMAAGSDAVACATVGGDAVRGAYGVGTNGKVDGPITAATIDQKSGAGLIIGRAWNTAAVNEAVLVRLRA